VPTTHFTPADYNWPYGPEPGAVGPEPIEPVPSSPATPLDPNLPDDDQSRDYDEESDCENGSIVSPRRSSGPGWLSSA
jgi:hypothetical protein